MSRADLVSVIVPFLNAERFIGEAIESVLSQTYDGWELLLVDDGSTDGGGEIARSYAELHPDRIRCFEHEGRHNRGTSASRNLALRAARGSVIGFLDADDVWLPRRLEHQMAILEAHPEAGMVYGKTEYWLSWTGKGEDARRDFVQKHGVPENRLVPGPESLVRFLRGQASVPCTCSVLVRRELVDRVGAFEDEFTDLYDDQVLYTKLCLVAPVYVSDDCLARYRRRPDSLCGSVAHTSAEGAARLVFLDWVDRYLTEQGGYDENLRQAMTKERWLLRRTPNFVRFGKKWLLRSEECLVPAGIRRRLWSRVELAGGKLAFRRETSAG